MDSKYEDSVPKNITPSDYYEQTKVALIDGGLVVLLLVALVMYKLPASIYLFVDSFNSTLLAFIIYIIYRFIGIGFFNGTIGMKLFRIELLNGEQQDLSIIQKLLASVFILYRGADYYTVKL
jgi:hypothetical protein